MFVGSVYIFVDLSESAMSVRMNKTDKKFAPYLVANLLIGVENVISSLTKKQICNRVGGRLTYYPFLTPSKKSLKRWCEPRKLSSVKLHGDGVEHVGWGEKLSSNCPSGDFPIPGKSPVRQLLDRFSVFSERDFVCFLGCFGSDDSQK